MCAPTFRSFNPPNSVSFQRFFYSAIGALFACLTSRRINPNLDDQSAVLLSPNPGEPPVIPLVQNAPLDGYYIATAFFYTGSILCFFSALLAIPGKWRLSNHFLSEGGSLIKRRDALEKWESDLLLVAPMHMILFALPFIIYGGLVVVMINVRG